MKNKKTTKEEEEEAGEEDMRWFLNTTKAICAPRFQAQQQANQQQIGSSAVFQMYCAMNLSPQTVAGARALHSTCWIRRAKKKRRKKRGAC